jgi:replicative superfamily II helicase
LRVNPSKGLFYFNDAYRPVPLSQVFIGVTETSIEKRAEAMNLIAYEKVLAAIRRGKQVMVFVHSRKETKKTADSLVALAASAGTSALFSPFSTETVVDEGADAGSWVAGAAPGAASAGSVATFYSKDTDAAARDEAAGPSSAADTGAGTSGKAVHVQGEARLALSSAEWAALQREVAASRNNDLRELFGKGWGIHHAGMLRSDRNLTERLFAAGVIKVLCCTATLAWGVNLPAHTVVIKGTQIYDAEAGQYRDLGLLDVMQIFGRAGRPQFDTSGEGIIITGHESLDHYLGLLTHTVPIESTFEKALADHLNAEIVSGTVTNVRSSSHNAQVYCHIVTHCPLHAGQRSHFMALIYLPVPPNEEKSTVVRY